MMRAGELGWVGQERGRSRAGVEARELGRFVTLVNVTWVVMGWFDVHCGVIFRDVICLSTNLLFLPVNLIPFV